MFGYETEVNSMFTEMVNPRTFTIILDGGMFAKRYRAVAQAVAWARERSTLSGVRFDSNLPIPRRVSDDARMCLMQERLFAYWNVRDELVESTGIFRCVARRRLVKQLATIKGEIQSLMNDIWPSSLLMVRYFNEEVCDFLG